MEQVLLVVQLLLATALIAVVLLQRSESDGFGLGSGGSNFLSGRATANLMTRTTAILAGLFIVNSLLLSIVAAHHGRESIVDTVTKQEAPATPAIPAVPVAGAEGKTEALKPIPPVAEKPAAASAAKPVLAKEAPAVSPAPSDKKPTVPLQAPTIEKPIENKSKQ